MSSVPISSSPEVTRALTSYILNTGYTETRMKELGLTKTPWKGSEWQLLLSRKIGADSALHVLIRLFFFGEAIESCVAFSTFPGEIADALLQTGMIQQEEDHLIPNCMLVHFEGFLVACDSVRRAQAGLFSDLVLGVNRPTQILGNCIVQSPGAEIVLDLGTGGGTLAFKAAQKARRVIGTDINERALEFAKFNADLNGVTNFEVRAGDRFEPVSDTRFDLILSNPPFFLTPSSKLLFTDNPFTLDSFVESLARQAPTLLKEGGYFQMLCEWVEVKGQPWRERLKNWFRDSGCDVLVLTEYEIPPVDYTLQRAAESASLYGETSADILIDHVNYFEERSVERIYGGLITIRRSTIGSAGKPRSKNWFVFEEMGGKPSHPIGDLLRERFASEDVLSFESDSRLLATKPRISKDAILVQESVQDHRAWKLKMAYLERRTGVVRRLGFNSEIAELIAAWDGSQDLNFLITTFARQKNLPEKQITQDFLALARRLASLSLISLGESREASDKPA
jgi:SAM-dependent methyltransferase